MLPLLPYALFIAVGYVATMPSAHAAAPNMKPGLWEVTVKMEMPGMPQGMQAQTTQRCITAKDLDDPRKVGPGADPRTASQCEVSNYRMQGNTASWDMACKGPEQMKGSGSMTYQGDRYSGVNKMTMSYAGRYVGECKPGAR